MAVTNQELFNIFLANPNMSDAQIVSLMEQRGISPAQVSQTFGIPEGQIVARAAATVPNGQSVILGDTRIAPQYQTIGSGMDQQIGGIENVYVEKVPTSDVNYKSPVGTPIQIYSPTGEFVNTIKTQKDQSFFGGLADAFKDPYVQAALLGVAGGAGAFDGLLSGGAGAGASAVTPLGDLGAMGALGGTEAGLLSSVPASAATGALTTAVTPAATTATILYKGDPVVLDASGAVAGVLSNVEATQGGAVIQGTVCQVGYVDATGTPVVGKVLPASTPAGGHVDGYPSPWVDIETSQGTLFEVLSIGTGTAALTAANTLGKFFGLITNGTPDAIMGQSAVQLQPRSGATYGTTDGGTAAATNRVVQVVDLAREPNNNFGDASLKLICRFVRTPINQ